MNKNRKFTDVYNEHEKLQNRKQESLKKLHLIRKEFEQKEIFNDSDLSVFAAGSLGRFEYGKKSDLDLFLISQEKNFSRLSEIKIYSELISINKKLGFDDFSNDGQFLKIYNIENLTKEIGSSIEDSENLFTTRMLFLLESQFLSNSETRIKQLKQIVSYYYKDNEDTENFRPLFLLNDILRFWRTLCLNYEYTRGDSNRPWKKKNLNLKFSRMLTVYSTVLPLISGFISEEEELIKLLDIPPLERLSKGLDSLKSTQLLCKDYDTFLSNYEYFIHTKETADLSKMDEKTKKCLNNKAKEFSAFLYKALNDNSVSEEYRQYLVI